MPTELASALERFHRLRKDVDAAEEAGMINLLKLEELAAVRADLTEAGASSFTINQARVLFERAMAIQTLDL